MTNVTERDRHVLAQAAHVLLHVEAVHGSGSPNRRRGTGRP